MQELAAALPHGPIQEVFSDVFFVTGTMVGMFGGTRWQFSRNMTVVREGDALTLINTVRLDDQGLAALERLGKVVNVVKIGSLHGQDDPFYVDRYGAKLWALPGMAHAGGLATRHELAPGGATPFTGCTLFDFRATKLPEGILRLDRDGGILVACDSLQNWLAPDEFFSEESRQTMAQMSFFQQANLGPVWMQANDPQPSDFTRLKEIPFRHALCGHGSPLRDTAREAYAARFQQVFGI
jgi:hypothetical protein